MTRPTGFLRPFLGLACVLALHAAVAGRVAAQSLGEVAQREAERRTHTRSGRVYTNGDLGPGAAAPWNPASVQPTAVPAESTASSNGAKAESGSGTPSDTAKPNGDAGSPAKAKEKRDEVYWRARVGDLQDRIARLNADIAALEAGSSTDENGATSTAAREQAAAAIALGKLRQDRTWISEELARVHEQARAANVPDSWLGR